IPRYRGSQHLVLFRVFRQSPVVDGEVQALPVNDVSKTHPPKYGTLDRDDAILEDQVAFGNPPLVRCQLKQRLASRRQSLTQRAGSELRGMPLAARTDALIGREGGIANDHLDAVERHGEFFGYQLLLHRPESLSEIA